VIYQPHEFADLFPLMAPEEFVALKADIKAHGLRQPVMMFEGRILDGRNRFRACQEVGEEIIHEEFLGTSDDALAFVLSANLHRRHLTAGQKAVLALDIERLEAERAKDRQKEHGGTAPGRPANTGGNNSTSEGKARDNQHTSPVERIPQADTGKARDKAAAAVGVNPRYVSDAKALKEEAPELLERVKEGEITIPGAMRIVNHRVLGTGENEWYTPQEHIEAARAFLGRIDLDPATSEIAQERIGAAAYFTVDTDGLTQEWCGRVWLNPPYAQPAIQQFMQKAVDEYAAGHVTEAVVLTHNYTDTAWFHIGAAAASAICFTRGRIGFLSPEGKRAAPTQGQAFFYFGGRADEFAAAFRQFGFVVMPG
jgi:ParB family chromosome partitioning protein